MNKILENIRNNKGSVTLYVLIAILFFVIILLSAFTLSQNKKDAQQKEYTKIKAEYEKDTSIEQEYVDITGKIVIKLTYNETGETYDNKTWTNKDIRATVIYPSLALNKKVSTIINNTESILESTETALIQENLTIKAQADVEGKTKQASREIKYIDKVMPEYIQEQNQISGNSIGLNFTAKDENSGLKEIRIFVDGNLETTLNYEFNNDTFSGSKEEHIVYTVNGFEENTKHLIKYEIEDYAGNIYVKQEEISTTGGNPVAQIVSINGISVSEDELSSYTYFSLEEALETCNNKGLGNYKIQMIADTEETTNTIEKGQNITIDLAGHYIRSNQTTIDNLGQLTILDIGKNVDGTTQYGKIVSKSNKAIINRRELTLGEKDNNEPLLNPEIATEGTGISAIDLKKESVFNFYDGIIKGAEGVQAYGTENSTVKINTPTYAGIEAFDASHPHWLVLRVQAGAVAKLGSTTYLTVQEAINAAQNGHYENKEVNLTYMQSQQPNGTYYFEENNQGQLVSNNHGQGNSTSNSYIEIDLTGKEGNHTLTVNASVSSQSADYGYATVTETIDTPNYYNISGFIKISGTREARDYSTTLQGGKRYYLHLEYIKNATVDTGDDQFVINNIVLNGSQESMNRGTRNVPVVPEEPSIIYLLGNVNPATEVEEVQTITEPVTVSELKNITLDLKGNTLTSATTNKYVIENYGKLKITDTYAGTKGSIISSTYHVIYNNRIGELTLEEGNIEISKVGSYSQYYYAIENYGNVYMTGGNVITNNNYNIGIINKNSKNIETTGGIITTNANYSTGIQNNSEGKVNIQNSTIISKGTTSYGIYNERSGIIETTNAIIQARQYCIYNKSSGTINLTSGKMEGYSSYTPEGIHNYNAPGKIYAKDVEFTKSSYGIRLEYGGYIDVKGCKFDTRTAISANVSNPSTEYCKIKDTEITASSAAIEIIGYANLEIDNITVHKGGITCTSNGTNNIKNSNLINTNISSGEVNFYNNIIEYPYNTMQISGTAKVNLNGGNTIKSTNGYNSSIYISSNSPTLKIKDDIIEGGAYGIDNSRGTANIYIGEKEGNINSNLPIIQGNTYGINNADGIIHFYDGIIKGKTDSICGNITEIEDNVEIIYGNDGTYNTATLGINTEPIAKIGETPYLKLQDAIDACPTNGTETTITILRNFKQSTSVKTESGQNIKIDLNNFTIESKSPDYLIDNNCNLNITDGNLKSDSKGIIKNTAGSFNLLNTNVTENRSKYSNYSFIW